MLPTYYDRYVIVSNKLSRLTTSSLILYSHYVAPNLNDITKIARISSNTLSLQYYVPPSHYRVLILNKLMKTISIDFTSFNPHELPILYHVPYCH